MPLRPHKSAEQKIATLTLDQKASLGSGASFWTSEALPGIPSFVMSDGPHGLRRQNDTEGDHLGLGLSVPATCFPPAVSLGQSWDPDLAHRVGAALAVEAHVQGVGVVLGPGINIKRDPRCGRNFEYLSEDPLLTATLATAWVEGLQAGGVGASLKHFAANNAENDRMRSSSDVDERPLREIYLRAFERVIRDSRPWTVMCSYNKINGVLASQNRWLLTDVLRTEWGFEGAVISDWGAVADRVAAVEAGLDLQMPGGREGFDASVVAAVNAGALSEESVNRAAAAVATVALQVQDARREVTIDADAHHALAREAAERSIVLLQNDGGLLPLDPSESVVVIGRFAVTPRYQGGGSSHVRASRVDIPLEEIRARVIGARVDHAPGYGTGDSADAAQLRFEAATLAGRAGAAIVFLGLDEGEESEGFDRDHIDLPDDQIRLLEAIVAAQPRTVVVLSAGGALRLAPVAALAPSILNGGLLGQAGGSAVAGIIFGDVNPSGRLAETLPVRLQDAPSYLNFPGEHSHVRYGEGIFVGYRGYDALEREVAFPFGHGLSYTTFEYDDLSVRAHATGIEVTVAVRNAGEREGREVVQIYASKLGSGVARPPRELAAFDAVVLAPGERSVLKLEIEGRDLAIWHDQLEAWTVEGGQYRIEVGRSSRDVRLDATVHVVGDTPLVPFTAESTIGELMAHPVGAAVISAAFGAQMPDAEDGAALGMDVLRMMASIPIGRILGGPGADADAHVGALLSSVNNAIATANLVV